MSFSPFAVWPQSADPLSALIDEIKQLESNREPKCYATASRLEDFMYGTPLSNEARFKKIELQKIVILDVWKKASFEAGKRGEGRIDKNVLMKVLNGFLPFAPEQSGDWAVSLPDGSKMTIESRDKRQYSSIAYALRAILSVKQDALMDPEIHLLELDEESLKALQDFLDILTLSALKTADQKARINHRYEISAEDLTDAWSEIIKPADRYLVRQQIRPAVRSDFKVIKQVVAQKVASYEAYNKITAQVFLRNLQVYFAKHRWPNDPEIAKRFKTLFAQAMVQYANDLTIGSERAAIANSHPLIRVEDVKQFADVFLPHRLNEYEDAIFFPNLPPEGRVVIESYDMDAFRDSGIHWLYLQSALEKPDYQGALEPDPFAAELLVENIAQYGVLLLRMAGEVGKSEGSERLHPDHIEKGFRLIQAKIDANAKSRLGPSEEQPLASSGDTRESGEKLTFFTDVTEQAGIDFMHRSSDWLNRLIRSYAMKSKNVGQLTIPPAFGGSGVAADDINGDGFDDILILSGVGNKLYLNDGKGGFDDITVAAGLDWRREDGTAGEPRQPIIADFDNDGRQDIFISYVDDDHRLFRNIGGNRFEDVSAQAGLGGKGLVGGPAVAFDYDNDGLLDIYIAYFGDYIHGKLPTLARYNDNGLANKLFRNQGGMKFEDATAGSGVANTGWGQAASHTDLDNDGWQDLIVGNDFGVNAYYRNNGDGTFEDISKQIGTSKPSYTMNVGITDLNSDLFPDIYISNIVTMNKDETYISPAKDTTMKFNPDKLANMRVVEANDLFISSADNGKLKGYQLSRAVERGYSSTGWSWDADFFDVDNDGDDDLYVVNGMNEFNLYSSENPYYTDPQENKKRNVYIPVSSRESNVFFINHGGKLQNVSAQSGADLLGNSRSVAFLDYDNDGDMDMILNNYHGPAVLYRNNAERLGNNWLKLKLVGDPGKKSNRDAIGARILATKDDGHTVWREIQGGIGYLSLHPKRQHIGLGKQDEVELTVRWPNGETATYKNVSVGRSYLIDQANGNLVGK
ncbi:MAG: FG-GAP-like repeat-containing protein [Gammaproteobacteria bacterium]